LELFNALNAVVENVQIAFNSQNFQNIMTESASNPEGSKGGYAMMRVLVQKLAKKGDPAPQLWAEAPPWQFAELIGALRDALGPLIVIEVDWDSIDPQITKTMH
jgi:hypothetical protein